MLNFTRKSMNIKHIIFLLLIFFLSGNLFIGCGKKETSNTGDVKQDQVQVPNTNDQQKQLNPTEQNKQSNELGISEGAPKYFPPDIPEPINSKHLGYLAGQQDTTVTFESTEKPKDIWSILVLENF